MFTHQIVWARSCLNESSRWFDGKARVIRSICERCRHGNILITRGGVGTRVWLMLVPSASTTVSNNPWRNRVCMAMMIMIVGNTPPVCLCGRRNGHRRALISAFMSHIGACGEKKVILKHSFSFFWVLVENENLSRGLWVMSPLAVTYVYRLYINNRGETIKYATWVFPLKFVGNYYNESWAMNNFGLGLLMNV